MPRFRKQTYRKRYNSKFSRNDVKNVKKLTKNNYKNRRNMMINNGRKHGDIIAPIYISPLSYTDNGVSFVGLPLISQIYRGNSLFDPDQSGSGHQPLGFDQIKALYSKYRVYGSAIEIRATPDNSDVDIQNIVICVFPSTGTTLVTDITTAMEQPYSKTVFRNLYSGNPVLKHYMSTATVLGVRKETVQISEQYAALSTTSPVDQWYWHVVIGTQDGTVNLNTHATIKIRYYSEFYQRIRQTPS